MLLKAWNQSAENASVICEALLVVVGSIMSAFLLTLLTVCQSYWVAIEPPSRRKALGWMMWMSTRVMWPVRPTA